MVGEYGWLVVFCDSFASCQIGALKFEEPGDSDRRTAGIYQIVVMPA